MNLAQRIKRKFKKLKLRIYLWEKGVSMFKTPEDILGYEKTCISICRKLIAHEDSKYSIAPLSDKRYIINKKLDIFIIIVDNRVEITNHVCPYVVKLNERDSSKLKRQFDDRVEKIRFDYEKEKHSGINNTLHSILEKLLKDGESEN